MSVPELLRHRVRYYTAVAAIGSREYIEKLFQKNQHRLGDTRKPGLEKCVAATGVIVITYDI